MVSNYASDVLLNIIFFCVFRFINFVQKFHSAAKLFHSKCLAQFLYEMADYSRGCSFKKNLSQGSPELSFSYIITISLLHIGNILEKLAKELNFSFISIVIIILLLFSPLVCPK